MKFIIKLVLLLSMFFVISTSIVTANEKDLDYTSLADYLNKIGLFQGTSSGYQLDRSATRAEGSVMLVRLLGKENEALKTNYPHPFLDVPKWASPYIGYLYSMGISKGVDDTHFGSDYLLDSAVYMTMLLRALGYVDEMGDFSWNNSIETAYELGILTSDEASNYKSKTGFLRNDMVFFSFAVLNEELKGGNHSLLRELMDSQVVPQASLLDYKLAPYSVSNTNGTPLSDETFQRAVVDGIIEYKDTVVLDFTGSQIKDIKGNINKAFLKLEELPGYTSVVKSWSYSLKGNAFTLNLKYRITKEQFNQATKFAQDIVMSKITTKMTDFSRELVIHDYIVDSTDYNDDNLGEYSIYTIYGALIKREAVCQGYADAFYYLCTLAGIECKLIIGEATSAGKTFAHAWNVVEIDGSYYQVDTTWDDPVMPNNEDVKYYDYFNITNSEITKNHDWDLVKYNYICNSTKYNYFEYHNILLNNESELRIALELGFDKRVNYMIFKVEDLKLTSAKVVNILNGISNYESCYYSVNEELGIINIDNISY